MQPLIQVGHGDILPYFKDLILRSIQSGVPYEVVHNASIITAIGCCGVQLYNFGVTVSIPFWDEFGHPESFFDKILDNIKRGLHTLCLLDIKVSLNKN